MCIHSAGRDENHLLDVVKALSRQLESRACSFKWIGGWEHCRMEFTETQDNRVASSPPVQRGKGRRAHLHTLDALLYSGAHGTTDGDSRRDSDAAHPLPPAASPGQEPASWTGCSHTSIREQIGRIKPEAGSLTKHYCDGTPRQDRGAEHWIAVSRQVLGRAPEMPLVVAAAQTAGRCSLSVGQAHDAPEGHKRLRRWGDPRAKRPLMLDWADAGNETRQLVPRLGFKPGVLRLKTRRVPWEDDREIDERRNQIERWFRYLRG